MNVNIIIAHPNPNSFNHAIAKEVIRALHKKKHEIVFHDLYSEKFNPLLPYEEFPKNVDIDKDLDQYCKEIIAADGIIIIHPNWWGQPPAILKGWVDRVIRPGVAYEFEEGDNGEGIPLGLLNEKVAIIFNTSNTPKERENNVFGDPLEKIWKNCIFDLCGVKEFYRKMFRVVVTSTLEERTVWLNEVSKIISKYFP